MNIKRVSGYIDKLYKNKAKFSKEQYRLSTELENFIPVVDDEVARMLSLIIRLSRPGKILEIGTGIGYSTISMAMAMKEYGGKIVTIESDEASAAQAKKNFEKMGLSEVIELKIGNAREIVSQINDEFDMIFQDADKRLYPQMFEDCMRILKRGGILMAEDTLFPVIDLDSKWSHLIAPIDEFNHLVVNNPDLESAILPVGDGLTLAVKIIGASSQG